MATQPWITPFLEALRATSNVAESARRAGVSSSTVYVLRRTDADFAAAWDNAIEDATDALEAEARYRAMYGVAEPVVHKGEFTPVWKRDEFGRAVEEPYDTGTVGKDGKPVMAMRPVQEVDEHGRPVWLTVRKPSDALLMFLLKGNRAKYGTERTEITGRDGAPLQVADATARAGRIAALLGLAKGRKANDVGDLL